MCIRALQAKLLTITRGYFIFKLKTKWINWNDNKNVITIHKNGYMYIKNGECKVQLHG